MFRQKLAQLGARALDALAAAAAALFDLALRNPRMTAKGVVVALVFLGASRGLELSAETQAGLATLIIVVLGAVGRDKPRKRGT